MLVRRIAVVTCAIAVVGCAERGGQYQELTSPNNTYVVRLTGPVSAPKRLFVEATTDLTVVRAAPRGSSAGSQIELFRADFLEDSFSDRYAHPEWLAENVIRFPWAGYKREQVSDRLEVRNESGRQIAYLTISALDLVVALDIASTGGFHSTTTGQFVSDRPFISVSGLFGSGAVIPFKSRSFPSVAPSGAEYLITVPADGRTTIQRLSPRVGPGSK